MIEIHPCFDVSTRTWFYEEVEAPSIRELLTKLGSKYKAKDYVVRTDAIVMKTEPYQPHGLTVLQLIRRNKKNNAAPPTDMVMISKGVKPKRASPKKPFTEIENLVLDMWVAEEPVIKISQKTGLSNIDIHAGVIRKARRRNDPRAILRGSKIQYNIKVKELMSEGKVVEPDGNTA
jgi:hypothetical protein